LVDVVNAEAVATSACMIKELDMLTCTQEDLAFTTPFSIKATRSDIVHALVVYFDIDFAHGLHKKVSFSTGPQAKYTHWKQTIFYVEQELPINKGEEIKGVFACRPNTENPRDYDIDLQVDFKGKNVEAHSKQFFRLR